MSPKKANIHLYPAPILNESRIFKQTAAIAGTGLFSEVIIAGTSRIDLAAKEQLDGARRIERIKTWPRSRQTSIFGKLLQQMLWSVAVFSRYFSSSVSVVNAHSVAVLPVAYFLSKRLRAKLIYDTHELETETSTSGGVQGRIFKLIERILISKCDAVFVVNESIAAWYHKRYAAVNPQVVLNVPQIESTMSKTDLKSELGLFATQRLYIHVGNLVAGRNIEAILAAFVRSERDDHVVFLGDGPMAPMVDEFANAHAGIHHISAVSSEKVLGYVAGSDVALCLIEPTCLSYELSLPNKALEYAVAGVPYFFSALPEINTFLGPSFRDWCLIRPAEELMAAMAGLTDQTILDGKERLKSVTFPSWSAEAEKMLRTYRELLRIAT